MTAERPLTEEDRFPLLDERGRAMLRRLRQHPHAPRYNHPSGERLTAEGLARVRDYAAKVRGGAASWRPGEVPPWVRELMAFCRREVPFHRGRSDWSDEFLALPPTTREDLKRQPWALVPDSEDLADLVVYTTSGTTGSRLSLPARPEVAARYLPLMEVALAAHGVMLAGGDRVAIVQVCAQRRTISQATVISYLDFAGYAKVNLHPDDWRRPDDPVRFLDDLDPQVYTGDPFAFAALMAQPLRTRPRALVSSATALLPGLKRRLVEHFGCPVVDVYSLNEAGPVAYSHGVAHVVLPPDLYVEVLDEAGRPCEPGVRGEIVLTGGINPLLPLLRYRTGDIAALDVSGPRPMLVGLQGRAPVAFRAADGRPVNGIDVTGALADLPLPFFALHEFADGSLRFRMRADAGAVEAARRALEGLFGRGVRLAVEEVPESEAWAGKVIQYTSDLPPPGAEGP